jgi:hypothetical protein
MTGQTSMTIEPHLYVPDVSGMCGDCSVCGNVRDATCHIAAPAARMAKPLHASKHCRHYSYVRTTNQEKQGPRCACGIDLREKPGQSLMCMPPGVIDTALLSQGRAIDEPCDWREEFTDDERLAWSAYAAESLARMTVIMPLIPGSADKRDRKFWGQTGSFPCPCCDGGTVRWLRARSNGHVHARCSSPDCFAVMQ